MDKPWLATPTESIPQLPAMLGGEELQFLYWMGQNSEGLPLIDLGTFLGGSAAAMAAGAESVGSPSQIYSYDLFEYGPWCKDFGLGTGWEDGDDVLPWVVQRTAEWANRLKLIKGDITAQAWTHGPTNGLFVDFTQTWQHHAHVCRAFLPHLRIGGILAHQDYVYIVCYWLHVFMEYYADCFEKISGLIMNSTAAWRYVRQLPQDAFNVGLNEKLSVHDMQALIDRSIARYEGVHQGLLQLARVRFFLHTYGVERAQEELDRLRSGLSGFEGIAPLLGVTQSNIDAWRINGSSYPKGFFRR